MKKSTSQPATKGAASQPRPMTKRQLSRHQRDVRLQRLTKIGFAALFALVAVVVAFGYWRVEISPGNEAIVRVRGIPISTSTYAKVLGYRQYAIDLQIARMQAFASQPGNNDNAALVQQLVQQQVDQLQQQRASLESDVLEGMADDELVRQEAVKRGITVSTGDLDSEIYKQYLPPTPVPTPTADASATATPTPAATATPAAPTPTPISQDAALAEKRTELGQVGLLSEAEYRSLLVQPSLLRDRLQEQLAAAVPTSAEQVWARHILLADEAQATDIITKLQAGGDFADLAKQYSTDTSNKDKGGDLGWFTRGSMVPEFEAVAFKLQTGQLSTTPVKTSYGYHIIQTLGYEENRPLTEDQLKVAREGALDNWLRSQRSGDPNLIQYDYSWERMNWARNWVSKNAKYLQPQRAPAATKKSS